jgi:hypothetical protein
MGSLSAIDTVPLPAYITVTGTQDVALVMLYKDQSVRILPFANDRVSPLELTAWNSA